MAAFQHNPLRLPFPFLLIRDVILLVLCPLSSTLTFNSTQVTTSPSPGPSPLNKTPIHIGGLFPITGSLISFGPGLPPAALLAIDHINQRQDILTNYTLNLVVRNTNNEQAVVIRELFRLIQEDPIKTMILGPFGAQETILVAKTSRWWNLIEVSPASYAPELSDRSSCPYFFRTRAALNSFDEARVTFMRSFGWKRCAFVTSQSDSAILAMNNMAKSFAAANITVVTFEIYPTSGPIPQKHLLRIKSLKVKIIFANAFDEKGRKLFCVAYRLGMTTSKYVWILYGGNSPDWMFHPPDDGSCSAQEITKAAQFHFVTSDVVYRTDNQVSISGLTYTEFIEAYRAKAAEYNVTPADFYAGLTYDAVWAMALALNGSLANLPPGKTLESFTYEDTQMRSIFEDQMYQLHFAGQSGDIAFSNTGDIATVRTRIDRFINSSFVTVGYHDESSDVITWTVNVTWKDGSPPADDRVTIEQDVTCSRQVFFVVLVCAVIGIIFAFLLFLFNLLNRDKKLIRMSSPNLNDIVLFGGVLCYLSTILFGLDKSLVDLNRFVVMCHVRLVVLSTGFSFGFGALFAKTWRVFKIFSNKTTMKTVIRDRHLLALVGAIVALDGAYFIVWFTVDPLVATQSSQVVDKAFGSVDYDYLYLNVQLTCSSDYINIWQAIILVMKGILLLFGAFLAWQTRAVTIPALNDSKYIGFSLYNVLLLSLLGVPFPFLLDPMTYGDIIYAITASCILLAVTLTLCIVFLPKVKALMTAGKSVSPDTNTPMGTATRGGQTTMGSGEGSYKTRVVAQVYGSQAEDEPNTTLATLSLPHDNRTQLDNVTNSLVEVG